MIPYREAAFIVSLDYIVGMVDVGRRRVDANEEQPTVSQQRRRVGEHSPHRRFRAVLEDLYGDDVVEQPLRIEVQKVGLDQPGRQTRTSSPELSERFPRRVEPDDVQARVDKGNVVSPVAASDV